jgi:undecaprenyl-diphosphatase
VNADVALVCAAAACFAGAGVLGVFVERGRLSALDAASLKLRGTGTRAAILFTRSGYWPALVAVNVLLVAALLLPSRVPLAAFVLAGTQLVAQGTVEALKTFFRRARPDDWLFHREYGHSFPSGHAATAATFYGGLLLIASTSPLPRALRLVLALALAVWIVGIPWSRMALAAHYGTDVIGGLLLGTGWLCLMAVLLRHLPSPLVFG